MRWDDQRLYPSGHVQYRCYTLALEARLTGGEEEQSGTSVGYTGGRGQDSRPVGGPEGDGLVDTDIVGGRLGRGNRAVPCASLVS